MLPVGSPATGDDFVDRERETAFILSTIKNDHVMLVAPRRFGGTSVINDFRRVAIGGFSEDVALSVVERVFREEGWEYSPEIGRAALDCVGEPYIPYFIMIVLSGLKEEADISGGVPSPALVERIYTRRILGSEGRHYFEHYSRRLQTTYSGQEAKAARAILSRASLAESLPAGIAYEIFRQSTGSGSEDAFRALLAQLNHDFYVASEPPGELRFYSKMLRDWWRIYYAGTW